MSADRPIFPPPIASLPAFDGPFDAFRLSAEGCEVLFASYPPGTEIPEHSHDTRNVGVITAGELILTRAGREERYRAGDWYELAAGEPHAARFDQFTAEVEFWFDAG